MADVANPQGELFGLFRRQFELCGVSDGEQVVVTYDAGTRPDYVEASIGAISSLGAIPTLLRVSGIGQINVPGTLRAMGLEATTLTIDAEVDKNPFSGNSPTIPALAAMVSSIDMVVDLVRLHHCPGRVEVLAAGKRMLTIVESPDTLLRLFPTQEVKEQSILARNLIADSSKMHVTSAAGTDFEAEIDPEYIACQYGFVDEPGRWDYWPSGFAASFSKRGSGSGQIVLDVGSQVLEAFRYVETPVTVTIEKGYVTDVAGDGVDAMLLREFLAGWDDPESYALSHIGWGMNPQARWEAMNMYSHNEQNGQDARGFLGGFMWSTGPTPQVGRFVPGHLDFCMRDCSVFLDDQPIVEEGKIVHPAIAAPTTAVAR